MSQPYSTLLKEERAKEIGTRLQEKAREDGTCDRITKESLYRTGKSI